jgi:hypothetical protein
MKKIFKPVVIVIVRRESSIVNMKSSTSFQSPELSNLLSNKDAGFEFIVGKIE